MIDGMADIDFSLLDVPRSAPVDDAEAYLRSAIAWHFGEDTGCTFWLRAARTLNFNPLTDVNTFADLRLFPNLLNELRYVPIEELIPRGYVSADHRRRFRRYSSPAAPRVRRKGLCSCQIGSRKSSNGKPRTSPTAVFCLAVASSA